MKLNGTDYLLRRGDKKSKWEQVIKWILVTLISKIFLAPTCSANPVHGNLLNALLTHTAKTDPTNIERKSNVNSEDYEVLTEFVWNEAEIKEISSATLDKLEEFVKDLRRQQQLEQQTIEEYSGRRIRTSHHVKRGAGFPTRQPMRGRIGRPRWKSERLECKRVATGKKCRIVKCGFNAPVDRISFNPAFGCSHRRV